MDLAMPFPKEWVPPRELTRSRPRDVRMSPGAVVAMIVVAAMAVGAVPLTVVMRKADARLAIQSASLRTSGEDVEAEIIRLWRTGRNRQPRMTYAFDAGGQRYQASVQVPKPVWSRLRTGSSVPVRFLPDDPAVSHPRDWVEHPLGAPLMVVIVALLLLPAAIFLLLLRRERRLLAEGVPAAGVITTCRQVKGAWTAMYQFRTPDGTTWRGGGGVPRRLEVGEIHCVLVDPEQPRRNAPYPLKLYRLSQY